MVVPLYHEIPMHWVALMLGLGLLVLCQNNISRFLLLRGETVGRMHGSGWGSSLSVRGRGYLPSLPRRVPPSLAPMC